MRRRALLAAVSAAAMMLTACAPSTPAAPQDRPLSVVTPLQFPTSDPVFADDEGSATLAYNVFQRLLTFEAGTQLPKPDAAECKFTSDVTYACIIKRDVRFHNGVPVSAEDVKFSLDRAILLARPGRGAHQLASVARVDAIDMRRLVIHLKHPDNNLAYALASPAGSIVRSKDFPADAQRTGFDLPVGSGPFALQYHDIDQVRLVSHPTYRGMVDPAPLKAVTLYSTGDPAMTERWLATDRADLLWGSATGPAPDSFRPLVFAQAQRSRLTWHPRSPRRGDAALRAFVRDATAAVRTQTSNLPAPLEPQVAEFPRETRPVAPAARVELTLGYPGRDPRARELARRVLDALTTSSQGHVSVILQPDVEDSDLWLTFERPATLGVLPILQHWIDFPLPGREGAVAELVTAYRRSMTADERTATTTALLRAAADDATVLPLTQGDEVVPVRRGIKVLHESAALYAGPAHQLGLWELTR